MKQICFPAILFVAVLASCSKDGMSYYVEYTRSYNQWIAFKDSSHNSYRYKVAISSWAGYWSETTITVKAGVVTERAFVSRAYANNLTGTFTVLEQWTEAGNQISTHQRGADPVTLDVIYADAKKHWLQHRDGARVSFETRNHGLISLCGYSMNGCQDDCFQGIVISFIQAI